MDGESNGLQVLGIYAREYNRRPANTRQYIQMETIMSETICSRGKGQLYNRAFPKLLLYVAIVNTIQELLNVPCWKSCDWWKKKRSRSELKTCANYWLVSLTNFSPIH